SLCLASSGRPLAWSVPRARATQDEAVAAQEITQSEIENRLWDAADELRVAMPEAQYASVIFPLMFWKYLSDTWDYNHAVFLEENEGLEDLSEQEAAEIEYRDYQSFEIPLIQRGTVGEMWASW